MAAKPIRYHDTSSGLSWNETIISTSSKPISSQIHDFLHRAVGVPPPLHTSKERGFGVDALETMALRCLLNNLTMLEAESLESVPEIMLKRLWREIQKNNLQSLYLWQIFTKVSPSFPPTPTYKTTTHHHLPLSLLNRYISISPSTYLTSLALISTIADYNTSIHLLPSLPNLVSLHINGSSLSTKETSMITDDTMRFWNKKARHANAFPYLRMLVLRFQMGVTEVSLAELDGFSALEMVVTSRCGINIKQGKKIVRNKGWKMTSKAFYAYADTALEDKPSGRNFVDLVDGYVKSGLTAPSPSTTSPSSSSSPTTPLSFIQLGRQPPTASTNILFTTNEIECWVKDDKQSKAKEEETRKRVQEKEEAIQENGKKRRKIKEAKRRDLFKLLEGM